MAKPDSSELAVESRLLRKRATWCGIVFSLAVLLTVLNVLPPVDVRYDVRSEILVSPVRLQRLLDAEQAAQYADSGSVELTDVTVLDASTEVKTDNSTGSNLVLVEVRTSWSGPYTEEAHKKWLDDISVSDVVDHETEEFAGTSRMARWQLETARHYLTREEFVSDASKRNPTTTNRNTFTLASSVATDGVPAIVASRSTTVESESVAALKAQIASAKTRVVDSDAAWSQHVETTSGVLEFAHRSELSATSSTIPMWMAASVIILGLAAGGTAGWFQYKLQSGGAHDPTLVASKLALSGLPVVGEVRMKEQAADETDWLEFATRKASSYSRRVARQLTRVSEWALWIWVYMIAARLVLDSMWRDVLFESPLAALGRVITGMP